MIIVREIKSYLVYLNTLISFSAGFGLVTKKPINIEMGIKFKIIYIFQIKNINAIEPLKVASKRGIMCSHVRESR